MSVRERCVHEHGHTDIQEGVVQAVRYEALHLIQLPLMLLAGDLLLGHLGESPLPSAELRRKLQNQTEKQTQIISASTPEPNAPCNSCITGVGGGSIAPVTPFAALKLPLLQL